METINNNKPPLIKRNKNYALVSFISGILLILTLILFYLSLTAWSFPIFLNYCFLGGMPIFSIIAFIFGLTGLKRKENKVLSLIGSVLGGLAILAIIALIIFLMIPRERPRAKDPAIQATMSQLRTVAELHYDRENSYIDFRNDEETMYIKKEIERYEGSGLSINISPDGKQYCATVLLPSRRSWRCVDSNNIIRDYTEQPKCSSNYYSCE